VQLVVVQFSETSEMKEKFISGFKNSLKSIFIIFFIPIFFWIINYLITGLSEFLFNIEGNKKGFTDQIYLIGAPESDDKIREASISKDFSAPEDIEKWNIFLSVFSAFFMLIICFLISLSLVQRIFDLFILFIISPFVTSVFPLDGGKRFFIWKDMVIAKFVSSTATILSFVVFLDILPKATYLISNQFSSFFLQNIVNLLVIIAGGLNTVKAPQFLSSLVGDSLSVEAGPELFNSARSVFGSTKKAFKSGKSLLIGKKQENLPSENGTGSNENNSIFSNLHGGVLGTSKKILNSTFVNTPSKLIGFAIPIKRHGFKKVSKSIAKGVYKSSKKIITKEVKILKKNFTSNKKKVIRKINKNI
jgi:hypothetical protein